MQKQYLYRLCTATVHNHLYYAIPRMCTGTVIGCCWSPN